MKALIIFITLLLSFVPSTVPKQFLIDGFADVDSYIVVRLDPQLTHIRMYDQREDGSYFKGFMGLLYYTKAQGKELIFATNGGMFMQDLKPLGLYVENGKQITPLNTRSASTNFYIKPNGVFYINRDWSAHICKTEDYRKENVLYATQSGPMLVVDGELNPKFKPEVQSYLIRNGVGVDSLGKVHFVLNKVGMNFYEFANIFIGLGCEQALFLDGDISDIYCPEVGMEPPYSYMSVMIAVIK